MYFVKTQVDRTTLIKITLMFFNVETSFMQHKKLRKGFFFDLFLQIIFNIKNFKNVLLKIQQRQRKKKYIDSKTEQLDERSKKLVMQLHELYVCDSN